MVKGGLKRKKADKAKNQLKVSKKGAKKARTKGGDIRLPKGLNVTDATFKTKKLVLLNQTQSSASKEALKAGLVTKKKLGLKELLAKLNNQSVSTRLDGLEGLQELLTAHKELVETNLGLIIHRLAPILSEKESKLRQAGVPLIENILAQVNSSALEPQYPVLCAHLCCGLSHINDDIQLESIRVLDSIIDSQPLFIFYHINQILPNCMDQISTNSSSSTSVPTKDSNGGCQIQNLMKANISSLQWRYMVIERIHKMLKILQIKLQGQTISQFNTIRKEVREPKFATKADIRLSHMGLYMDRYGVSNSSRFSSEEIFTTSNDHVLKQNTFSAEKFARQLLPILIYTWNEVILETQSSKHKKTVSSGISLVQEDSVPILISIVNTTQAILQLVKEESQISGLDIRAFMQGVGSELAIRIVSKFPYEVSHIKGRQGFSRKQGNNSVEATKEIPESTHNSSIDNPSGSFELNLSIISVYVELLTLDENMQQHKDIRVRNDLDNLVTNNTEVKFNLTTYLEQILVYITGNKHRINAIGRKKENGTVMTALKKISKIALMELKHTKLFNNLILLLYHSKPTSTNVVELMCYLTSTQTYNNDFEYIIQPFITDLPNVLFSENISCEHLKIIQLLLKKNNVKGKYVNGTFVELKCAYQEKGSTNKIMLNANDTLGIYQEMR